MMDTSINFFLTELGGLDFLGLAFAILIIIAILMAIIRPFDI
jgi:hypothetical protein